jgi:hypothetical protein
VKYLLTTYVQILGEPEMLFFLFRWMNKMGLAAIAYDKKKLTEHAIFPSVRRADPHGLGTVG